MAPALPDVQRELDASTTKVAWLLTAYLLSASVATPILGRMGDVYGEKRVLVIVLAGPITDRLSYHWLFWIPLVAVVLAAVASLLFVPESPIRSPGRIGWLGALLLWPTTPRGRSTWRRP